MLKDFLRGMLNPDTIYQAEDDRRFLSSLPKELGIETIADTVASQTGLKPTIKVNRQNRNGRDTEFVTKVTIPIKQREGRIMEQVTENREVTDMISDGPYAGYPNGKHQEGIVIGEKPSKKQTLTDAVEMIIREGGGRNGGAEVEVVSRQFSKVDRGTFHRKVFQENVKSSLLNISSSGFGRQEILSKVNDVLKDLGK